VSSFSSLARSSAIMTAGTMTSRVLGFVKASMLATAIGVNFVQADAFDVANKVPNTLYMLLAGGVVNAVLVPQIVRASKREDGGEDFTNRLLTLSFLILGVVTIVATAAAPLLVWLYSSGWSPAQLALSTAFAYWCLPQLFFYGLYTLLGQVLNAKSSFGPYMWAPVLNNVVAIAGLAAFILIFGTNNATVHDLDTWTPDKIALIAGTATLGVAAQALILIWPLKRIGFKYKPKFGFRGVGLGSAGKVAFWTFAAMLIGQIGFLIISRVASGASIPGDGNASNTAYTNAYLVFMLPHSLIAVSLATALFTSLAKNAADEDTEAVVGDFSMGVRMVGMVNTFATCRPRRPRLTGGDDHRRSWSRAGHGHRSGHHHNGLRTRSLQRELSRAARVLRLRRMRRPVPHPAAADHLPVPGGALGIDLPEVGDGGDHRTGHEPRIPDGDDHLVCGPEEAPRRHRPA
jgi:putative peptidoglycan lipid II flippase